MCLLKVSQICKKENDNQIVDKVNFIQEKGQKIAVVGETGSGKSTLLKIIGGLVQQDSGEVYFENSRVLGPDEKLMPGHKSIAYLSQQFELPRFYTVANVLAYENRLSERAANIIYDVCQINHLLNRNTDQLSGGEKQRIALARSLITIPKLLLLDEPFSNIDMVHKSILKSVIDDIGDQLQITCILVSHDPLDSLSWADSILVMKNGRVLQQGFPHEIYKKPATIYVGSMFGSYNLIHPSDKYTSLPGLSLKGKSLFVRPEEFKLVEESSSAMKGIIQAIRYFGSYYEIEVKIDKTIIIIKTFENNFQLGDHAFINWSPKEVWYL